MRDVTKDAIVEGLRLTMRGDEIRRRLDQRILVVARARGR